MIGSPPMPIAVDWPRPRARQLADRFISKRARARHDADPSFFMNMPGHDADLAFAGRDDAGAVRADHSRVALSRRYSFALTMSATGIPSVMQTTSGRPASAASIIASAANAGGT